MKNFIKLIDNGIDIVMRIIFVVIALVGLYIIIDSVQVYYGADQASIGVYRPDEINAETLREISKDAVAWITLDDTGIDYPVMQGNDNTEYLNKDPYGNYALAGSIFLDSANDPEFVNDYSLIYGHHMAGGRMFGALDAFEDETYFDAHLTGTLETKSRHYLFTVYAFLVCEAADKEIFSTDAKVTGRKEFITKMAVNINQDAAKGRMVALTTCKDPGQTNRSVLIGYITEQ